MKFLCVPCDQPMNLHSTHGPFDGSMSIVYQCSACDVQMAMLTNKAETQMVRSLGVKIGGRTTPAEPMETLRSNLAVNPEESASEPAPSGGKCPFTGVISDAIASAETESAFTWTSEALTRLESIPDYVQPMVKRNIEDYARAKNLSVIDDTLMDDMKGQLGM